MRIVISDSKKINSQYDSESFILHTKYSGSFDSELAMQHFHKIEKFAKTNQVNGAIADLRKLSGSYNRIIDYLKEEGYPTMRHAGLKAEAFVITDDIMIKYLTEKLAVIIREKQIKVKIFESYNEANTWILDVLNN